MILPAGRRRSNAALTLAGLRCKISNIKGAAKQACEGRRKPVVFPSLPPPAPLNTITTHGL